MAARTPDLQKLIEGELHRFNHRWFQHLNFCPELEQGYEQEQAPRVARFHMRVGAFLLFSFNLFLISDWYLTRASFPYAVIARLLIFTPVVAWLLRVARYNERRTYREVAIATIALLAVLTSLYLGFGDASVFAFRVEPVILTILILLTTVFRIMPSVTSVAVALSVALTGAAMVFRFHLPVEMWAPNLTIFSTAALLMLTANYLSTRARRIAYLMQLRSDLQSELLSRRNHELRKISERDELTGVNNRYSYERHVKAVFADAVKRSASLSVVMVDVDHFKITNDQYGHLYGDRVLRRVGALIQEALRGEKDFVARFGGEEFVVLLPDTHLHAATKVAERIRNLVEIAGSPAPFEDVVPMMCYTTVSCGVASMVPSADQSPEQLLAAADQAMYRAKAEGRNRTCIANSVVLQ